MTFEFTAYRWQCTRNTTCYFDVRWDDPTSGATLCTMPGLYYQTYNPRCGGTIPYDDQGVHTFYIVDHSCTSGCASYDSGTYTIMGCNPNDTITNFDANTYGIQPYAGFDPTTASVDEMACYGLDQSTSVQQGLASESSGAPTSAGAGSGSLGGDGSATLSSDYDTITEASGNPVTPVTITATAFNLWAGYMNQGNDATNALQTGKNYTRVFARWTAQGTPAAPTLASNLSPSAMLTWVGLGGYGTEYLPYSPGTPPSKRTPCAAGPNGVIDTTDFGNTPNTECIIQAGTISFAPQGGATPTVKFWYENFPAETIQYSPGPAVNVGDSVDVFVHYAPGPNTTTYTFHNITRNKWYLMTSKNVHDPVVASAECVAEQGFFRPYGEYTTSTTSTTNSIPWQGCGVRWIDDPFNDKSKHGIARMGNSSDPGTVTDLYGYVGWPHNSLDTNGNFTLSCRDRYY